MDESTPIVRYPRSIRVPADEPLRGGRCSRDSQGHGVTCHEDIPTNHELPSPGAPRHLDNKLCLFLRSPNAKAPAAASLKPRPPGWPRGCATLETNRLGDPLSLTLRPVHESHREDAPTTGFTLMLEDTCPRSRNGVGNWPTRLTLDEARRQRHQTVKHPESSTKSWPIRIDEGDSRRASRWPRHSLSRDTTLPTLHRLARAQPNRARANGRTNGRGTKAERGRNAAPLGGSAPRRDATRRGAARHEFQTELRARIEDETAREKKARTRGDQEDPSPSAIAIGRPSLVS